MIAELIIEQGFLKLRLRNLSVINELTDEMESQILDTIASNESRIKGLKEILKQI